MQYLQDRILLLMVMVVFISCHSRNEVQPLFTLLSPQSTGIHFNNLITENDSINILDYQYIYNGGGVGIADFNNDSLPDILFSGNMVPNKLYLNKGKLRFEDISHSSGIEAPDQWCSGINIADVNQDGWQDIYICTNTYSNRNRRKNLLFINQTQKDGPVKFAEMAEEYGVADTSYSMQSVFFDYDRDGDLDLFIINNKSQETRTPTTYSYKKNQPGSPRLSKLYRNNGIGPEGHPYFTDVSLEAGINLEGYSLGVNVTDINRDGWKDIYISNDFVSDDLFWINNRDGTFTNKSRTWLKHTCYSAMGNDVADINNDGLVDIIALDMLPEDNYRKKTMLGANSYNTFINNRRYGYMNQYTRNVLQLNQGIIPGTEDLMFSEVAMLAGIPATDWSWCPLVNDFDGDGWRDIIITNGFPKDVTDRDFMDFQAANYALLEKNKLLEKIPRVKINNYAFRNTGGIQFEDVSESWGLKMPSFSNGAAYGDLDNDGDLDIVINNIDDVATVLRNDSHADTSHHYLRIKLHGKAPNRDALGSIIDYKTVSLKGMYEHSPCRGYLSCVDPVVYLGLGKDSLVDLTITWPDGKKSNYSNVRTNQRISISIEDATEQKVDQVNSHSDLLMKSTLKILPDTMKDDEFIDFDYEPLLLHKLSQYGPGIAVSDINHDGLDDYYLTGSAHHPGRMYYQQASGTFKIAPSLPVNDNAEYLGVLFFDADQDGDQDVYLGSGGREFKLESELYADVLLRNQHGQWKSQPEAISDLPSFSTGCVRACDFDRDGDLDLFVAGRVLPNLYPLPATSYILVNESSHDQLKFIQGNNTVAPLLDSIGLVCDAIWTDFDNDGWQDLILAGEWMPVKFLHNHNGKFEDWTEKSGVENMSGWWNSITSGDYDKDGDMDYVVSNYGLNSTIKASQKQPISIYSYDFDRNSNVDAIPAVWYKDTSGIERLFTYHGRGDLFKELTRTKKKISSYSKMGVVSLDTIISKEEQDKSYKLYATTLETSYFENTGNGVFSARPLPLPAQLAPVFGMISTDVNSDGLLDIIMVGNDYGTDISLGWMDAFNGLVLTGDGKGNFTPLMYGESGFYVPGDAKAMACLYSEGKKIIAVTQNNDIPLGFEIGSGDKSIFIPKEDDVRVQAYHADGSSMGIFEIYYGNGFLSQSTRKISIPKDVVKLKVTNYKGEIHEVNFKDPM